MSLVSDPIIYFGILAAGILLAPVLSSRLRIPDLIILLIFGALIGPNALNVLDRSNAVVMLGSVGKIYIMFLAGLEIDFFKFRKSYGRSIVLGILTFIIPQTLGTLAGRYILEMNWTSSVLLASMFASHTLLAYPQASRLGIAQREPVAITVGATIFTDTLALLVLAVIADSAKGEELNFKLIATIFIGMAVLTILIWKFVPLLSRWFFSKISEESNTQYLFVIMILCLFAYLSYLAKMEPIIGAFLVGAAFNRLIPEHGKLMNRIHFTGNTLFIPIFLISVGMLVDIKSMLFNSESWFVGGIMIAAVIISKYIAAQFARLFFRYSSAAGNVIFGLSVVQAAATLAAVMVGYKLKILTEEVLNGTILMILATCLLGSWIVEHFGRKMAIEEKTELSRSSVNQRLLVMISSLAEGLPLLDLAFLQKDKGSSIHPYTIINKQDNIDEAIAEGENLLGQCLAHSAAADIEVEPGLRVETNIADGINHITLELNTDTVLLGYSEKEQYFGSVRHNLVENCRSRLLFCKLIKPLSTVRRILLPVPALACRRQDISDLIKTSKIIAKHTGSEIHLLLVNDKSCQIEKLVESTKPDTIIKTRTFNKWQDIIHEINKYIKPDDLIFIPLDRVNGIMWSPGLEHLPQIISRKFPENNMLIDYPSLPVNDLHNVNEIIKTGSDIPRLVAVEALPQADINDVIKLLAKNVLPDNVQCNNDTCRHLTDLIKSFPLELAPGVVLVHTQNSPIKDTVIAVCHIPDGIAINDLETCRFLIALVSSSQFSPEAHLKSLSYIAAGIRQIYKKHDLTDITSASEFCRLLENLN